MTEEKLSQNFNLYLKNLKSISNENDYKKIEKIFYDYDKNYIATTPISPGTKNKDFEEGGFILHSLRSFYLVDYILKTYEKISKQKYDDNFKKRLKFLTLICNFGKVLDMTNVPNYKWNVDYKNELKLEYRNGEENTIEKASLKTLFILQKYGIELTHDEFQAIYHKDFFLDRENYNLFSIVTEDSQIIKTPLIYFLALIEYQSYVIGAIKPTNQTDLELNKEQNEQENKNEKN